VENPFVYGEVVPAAAFVNRTDELRRLTADLTAGQKVFLISPRRYGKSSLIRRVLAGLDRRGSLCVEVTVSSYSSYVAFLEGYARAVLTSATRWERAMAWVRDALGTTRPELRVETDPSGSPTLELTFPGARGARDVSRLAAEVFQLPARLADERRRPVIVALDEFQAIGSFNGGSVEESLRAAVQHQRRVGYVFAGSEPTLMEQMLTPKRPFYKAGPVMRLEKIPADQFARFIESRFARTGIRTDPGFGLAVVELAGQLPYDVQRLAHEVWDDARGSAWKRVGLEHLHATLRRLLAEQSVVFEAAWERLTLAQRAALRAVVLEDGRELLSADVRGRHRLGGPSTVQAGLAALMRHDVITREGPRYVVVDSLMREWVVRRTF